MGGCGGIAMFWTSTFGSIIAAAKTGAKARE
jgi:hypothetical protein